MYLVQLDKIHRRFCLYLRPKRYNINLNPAAFIGHAYHYSVAEPFMSWGGPRPTRKN